MQLVVGFINGADRVGAVAFKIVVCVLQMIFGTV
jgi:hypothetical protein